MRTASQSSLAVFVVVILAASYRGGIDSWTLLGVWLAVLVAGIQLNWLQVRTDTPPEPPAVGGLIPKLAIAAAVLYGLGLLWGAWISPLPGYASELCFSMGLLIVGFALTRSADRAGLGRNHVWRGLQLAAAVVAAVAVTERLLTGARAYAVLSDPNLLAGWFNACLLMSVGDLASKLRQTTSQPISSTLALITLFALAQGSTGSLSGLVCLAFTLPPLLVAIAWRQPHRLVLGLAAVGALVFAIAVLAGRGGPDQPSAKLQQISQHSSFTVRVEMTEATVRMYSDHSWLGNGLGSYKWLYPQYRGPLDTGTSGDLAHNDYVQVLLEGGPLLLGALLMMVIVCLGVLSSILRGGFKSGLQQAALPQLAAAAALLALLMHAGMNFIFYSAVLSLTAGVLLATAAPSGSRASVAAVRLRLAQTICAGVAALLIVGTLGARGLFVGLILDRCHLHGCNLLRADAGFMKKLADYLSATQPTWLLSRDYLVNKYLDEETKAQEPTEQAAWRERAMVENLGMLEAFPLLTQAYVTTARMLERDPALVRLFAEGFPRDVEGLYRRALQAHPQHLENRLRLAAALRKSNRDADAYSVLFTEGMRYWKMGEWGDSGRMQLLTSAIPLAASLRRCNEALEMAQGLKVFQSIREKAVLERKLLPDAAVPAPSAASVEDALQKAASCQATETS